jgi:branched-chain amino acid transport system ATP-binding protein
MRFGGLVAIGDVSFAAKRGEITALIGPNGAGKTTVFNCITGFYKPTEGMLTMNLSDGQQFLLERLPGNEINSRAKVARTFQNIRLFSGMTVLENLLVAQHNKLMKASGYTIMGLLGVGGYKQASGESINLAKVWLEKADLLSRADDPAGDLPYGAQRRLEIARAMCTKPELLCLDEPAAGLNPRESLQLNDLLMGIKNETNTSILLIEHDMSVVMKISDHVVVLEYGRKISDGDPTFVKSDPKVIAAYLGVEDEEVGEVLVAVGDGDVIESFDAEPDREHGPGDSASMFAGPISDTVGHSDPNDGETLRVDAGASRSALVGMTSTQKKPEKKLAAKKAKAPASKPVQQIAAVSTAKISPKAAVKPAAASAKSAAKAVKPAAAAKPVAKAAEPAPKPAEKTKSKSSASAKPAEKTVSAKPAAKASTPKPAATSRKDSGSTVISTKKPVRTSNWLARPRGGKADDLLLIRGIGPVNKRKLNEHGIFHFDQIAAWTRADIAAAEAYLEFDGRIDREDWIGQAAALAASGKRG